jgi:Spore Coat Protein U domain
MNRIIHKPCSVLAAFVIVCWSCFVTVFAGVVEDTTAVHCLVQSASLNFGRLNLQRPSPVPGEGELVLACQNTSSESRRVTFSLALPSVGVQTTLLQSGRVAMPVMFYRDPQYAMRWGDDLNGAAALRVALDFTPNEHKVLRLPVYALLHSPRVAAAGVYLGHAPVTLTTTPR